MDIFEQDSVASRPSLARAIIVENVDPDKRGKVKVSYPWLKDGSDTISHWSRVALPFASKDAGFCFIPEIGDEVIVMFEDGNIETPIVIASLYSEKNPPPVAGRPGDNNQDEKNTVRYIKTKSGGTILEMRFATSYSRSVERANTPPTSIPSRAASSTRGSA